MLLIALILIFILVALTQIWKLRVAAEKNAVAWMVGTLRSALGVQVAATVARNGVAAAAAFDGTDPMKLLDETPHNYESVNHLPPTEALIPYHWYFDESEGVLVYRVANNQYVETSHPEYLRFRVTALFIDNNHNGRFESGVDSLTGVDLVPLDPYRWRRPLQGANGRVGQLPRYFS